MRKKWPVRRRGAAAGDQGKEANTASAHEDDEHYGSWMDAFHTITPILANPDLHSPEELITAIAKMLRLKGITMEVLRDTSVGAYVKDLCYHPSVQGQDVFSSWLQVSRQRSMYERPPIPHQSQTFCGVCPFVKPSKKFCMSKWCGNPTFAICQEGSNLGC